MTHEYKIIDQAVLRQAEEDHERYLIENPHKRVICDSVITPFCDAMKAQGYESILTSSKCSTLRVCINDSCKQSYSELYKRGGHSFWACPHCQQISQI